MSLQNRPSAAGGRFDGTDRARTRSDGRKQGRDSADGCGEDRASPSRAARRYAISLRESVKGGIAINEGCIVKREYTLASDGI